MKSFPEGNSVHYDYYDDKTGHAVFSWKGNRAAVNADWAKYCTLPHPPEGERKIVAGEVTSLATGGFINGYQNTTTGFAREFKTDGFGRIIQSEFNLPPWIQTAVDQIGYDRRGNVIWKAKLAPDTGMSHNAFRKPAVGDANLLHFSEYEYDLIGRVTTEKIWVLETGETLIRTFDRDDRVSTITVNDRGAVTKTIFDGRNRASRRRCPMAR